MDELFFGKIRSISYNKYFKNEVITFNFTVGQELFKLKSRISRIIFDDLHLANTGISRYVIFIEKNGIEYNWKGIPSQVALVEEDVSSE